MRLSKIAKELNISISRLAEFLDSKGHSIDVRPTTKISQEQYDILLQEFNKDFYEKQQSSEAIELKKQEKEEIQSINNVSNDQSDAKIVEEETLKIESNDAIKKDDNLNVNKDKDIDSSKSSEQQKNTIDSKKNIDENNSKNTLKGPVITGETIDLSLFERNKKNKQTRVASSSNSPESKDLRKKRRRITQSGSFNNIAKTKKNTKKKMKLTLGKFRKK